MARKVPQFLMALDPVLLPDRAVGKAHGAKRAALRRDRLHRDRMWASCQEGGTDGLDDLSLPYSDE